MDINKDVLAGDEKIKAELKIKKGIKLKIRGLVDNFLKIKNVKEIDLDDKMSSVLHQKIIKEKRFLNKLYTDFYNIFKKECIDIPEGLKVEIGSGGGFLKEIIPDVITSDVVDIPNVDKVFSAEKMPFEDNSVSVFFLLNILHHIPNCNNFFRECERCLIQNGKIVMIEPSNTRFNKFFYKYFHHEPFDEKAKNWELKSNNKRMSLSNQALPYIIFIRDRYLFENKFKKLKLKSIDIHTPFRYILSGGVSIRQLVPTWSYSFFKFLDKLFSKIGIFYTIILRKNDATQNVKQTKG